MESTNCGSCFYCSSYTDGTYKCRRYPPIVVLEHLKEKHNTIETVFDARTVGVFPRVNPESCWCGEFKLKEG